MDSSYQEGMTQNSHRVVHWGNNNRTLWYINRYFDFNIYLSITHIDL